MTPLVADYRWPVLAYAYGVVVMLGLSYFLVRMPFQVSDNVGNMLNIARADAWEVIVDRFNDRGYMRPFLWGLIKVVFDLSGGHYFIAYRAFHVLQLVALALLFVRLLEVRTAREWLLVPFAFVVLLGTIPFAGTVREAFPINTFLTMMVCSFAVSNLGSSRGGWWTDVAACLILLFAIFTLETGLLVWVCLVAGYIAGYRGVSWRAVAASTLLFAAYFFLRFLWFDVGSPGLSERSAGYGFAVLDPEELEARFGANPLPFYVSNVLSSISAVLFSEPQSGVWRLSRGVFGEGQLRPGLAIAVVTSTLTTLLMVVFCVPRLRRWIRFRFEPSERPVAVFVAILIANAVISYPYVKDPTLCIAAGFYALAAFAVVRHYLVQRPVGGVVASLALTGVLAVASTGWCVRAVGLHYQLRYTAYLNRNDWTTVMSWLERQHPQHYASAAARDFVRQLQQQAIQMYVPPPFFVHPRAERYFE